MALGDSCLSGLNTLGDKVAKSEKVSDYRDLDYFLGWNIGSIQTVKSEREAPQYGSLYASRLTSEQIKKAEKVAPKGLVDTRNGCLMSSGFLL